jgi:hypothetical protein
MVTLILVPDFAPKFRLSWEKKSIKSGNPLYNKQAKTNPTKLLQVVFYTEMWHLPVLLLSTILPPKGLKVNLIDFLVFNATFSNISAISWRGLKAIV